MSFRRCGMCKQELPISEFSFDSKKCQFNHRCKACMRAYAKERYHKVVVTNPVMYQRAMESWSKSREATRADPKRRARRLATTLAHKNRKYREDPMYKVRSDAHNAANHAIRNGTLIPQPCRDCGRTKPIHAHHTDYSKPLDVIWLCPACHRAEHQRLRALYRPTRLERKDSSADGPDDAF